MADRVVIRIFEIIGSGDCISSEDGQKVYDLIKRAFDGGRDVNLSFQNIDYVISAFLHPAIGQLYGSYSEDFVRDHLHISEMSREDLATLKRVVEDAKAYFKNPERAEAARRRALEDDDGEG
ncbi:MAG: STAS-like domain-containing protein [Candidatus Coatesbacteria bacterium]|nr:STAS-like domain-containing protein [Candidatus Coatesbacteria bacterium]